MKAKKVLIITLLLASVQFLSAMHRERTFFLKFMPVGTKQLEKTIPITRAALNRSAMLKNFFEDVEVEIEEEADEGTVIKNYNRTEDTITMPLGALIGEKWSFEDIRTFVELSQASNNLAVRKKLSKLPQDKFFIQLMLADKVKNEMILDQGVAHMASSITSQDRLAFLDGRGLIPVFIENLPEDILKYKLFEKLRYQERTLEGHKSQVTRLLLLPNGNIASASADKTIRIWNPEKEKSLRTLTGHTENVNHLLLLPNGNIASASNDKTIKIWNPATGKLLKTLTGHKDGVNDLLLLPNGNIASASFDNTIRIWNPVTGKELRTLTGRTWPALHLLLLPNGNIASMSDGKTIKIWNPATGKLLKTLTGHKGWVNDLLLLPNGNIASASDDKTIRIWNPSKTKALRTLTGHTSMVWFLLLLPNGNIASASWDETIKIWNPATGTLLKTLKGHTDPVDYLLLLPNGNIASTSDDKTIRIWDPATGKLLKTLTGHADGVRNLLLFLPDGNIVSALESENNNIRIWHTDVFKGLTFKQIMLVSGLHLYRTKNNKPFVINNQSKKIFKTLPPKMQLSLLGPLGSLGWAITLAQVEKAEIAVQEINRKLGQINNNFNTIHATMLKAKQYDEERVRRIKSGGTYLQEQLNKLPYRLLAAVFKEENAQTINNWRASVSNVIALSKEWHELLSGDDPDFKTSTVTAAGAKKWAETWYWQKKKEIPAYEQRAKTFVKSPIFGTSSKTLQNIFRLMHEKDGMLDGVYYTVGAPLGLKHIIYLRKDILGAWPKFRLKKSD